ncbi:MAG: lantibiotic protection ABC transporter ATP-binding protein [Slackia sp.]|nr:lantibiotic protection ABC transporter ATP-binding protein [Slackia sp.]
MACLLETRDLTKTFGRGGAVQTAVDAVNLHVEKGRVYGLLGPNGAGKSTLLKMVTGMLHPTSGDIVFDGHPWRREDLYDIGSLIETPPLYPNLTARENMKVRTTLLGIDEACIDAVLEKAGISRTGSKRAGSFSLGMKQRLGIALALAGDPKLLVLDEPANGLDPIGIEDLRAQIRSFAEAGITVIVSSHILTEVAHVADRVGIIVQGTLAFEGDFEDGMDLEALFMDICRRMPADSLAGGVR